MSISEQEIFKEKYYSEAIEYMDNAKECLKKAKQEDNYYRKPKYVKRACKTAYNGSLVALDCFLILNGVDKPKRKERKSIEYYQNNIAKVDTKMQLYFDNTYKILYLSGYYDGLLVASVIKAGFDLAYKIIEKIKPMPES